MIMKMYLWWWSNLLFCGSYTPPTSTTISQVASRLLSRVRIILALLYLGICFNIQQASTSSQWKVPSWVPIIGFPLDSFTPSGITGELFAEGEDNRHLHIYQQNWLKPLIKYSFPDKSVSRKSISWNWYSWQRSGMIKAFTNSRNVMVLNYQSAFTSGSIDCCQSFPDCKSVLHDVFRWVSD